MKKCIVLTASLIILYACEPSSGPASAITSRDSSLIDVPDSTSMQIADSVAVLATTDTVTYKADRLVGRWLQPVPGLDKEKQGFLLKKNGKAVSINTYSLVYDKWLLQHDTLLLWNHAEGVHSKDTAATVDTTIIQSLTDTTLVLFPIKAVPGYQEQYTKEKVDGRKGKR
ncbi:hypothetical protein GO495_18280 [Chitinophaga oryziterrae]|uniref:Lipocalin-like domain-containing protein n=1 Tax=Chitinophaga oryziterrae TaxID=1031224 RepID=A0A6N8JBC3_9BACT|nr:lipocalin family protein [Chitinophaga oryziterrae]MVT42547.1 hypothetical protein [Chitinophaga oryziterrae]